RHTGINGPLFLGMDTHALSAPAHRSALEVLAANGVEARFHRQDQVTPTPVISFSILEFNARHEKIQADGIVITPSHNPPEDGGFKYNPPHGGPADTDITDWIEKRANELILEGLREVKKIPYTRACVAEKIREFDYITPYIKALPQVLDMHRIAASSLRLCADALGGSAGPFWEPLAEMYKLRLEVVNACHDPSFSFMSVDKDGKIRMDCSSPWAMAGLLAHKDDFDLCFGNDPDADRHGIVTPAGLMNPNHYLAVCVDYLFRNRPRWKDEYGVGKTVVTSAMLDRVAATLKRHLYEVPVGFKWFVAPFLSGSCAFGGEESAGASFLRMDGRTWSTDKDGIILNLLAAEITASTGKSPDILYEELTQRHGVAYYARHDAPATVEQKQRLKKFSPAAFKVTSLAGDAITGVFTHAPGNGAPVGGLKISTRNGWFAARPSGTEDIYKIYTESFISPDHLDAVRHDAEELVADIFNCKVV
ncbi:MAG: phosphoglucomutase, alpha-D-glucose phosphate-specific, partial [Deltaproteobacteria bacterium]|nr:phosphoglucomutase, alpha-D-glucose phosphate-specific [Deltaproteobacteria bacterium]